MIVSGNVTPRNQHGGMGLVQTFGDQRLPRRSTGMGVVPVIAIPLVVGIMTWLGGAAATIAATLGISTAFVASAMSALAAAGVAAAVQGGSQAVDAIVKELEDDESPAAQYANQFYAEQWDTEYTDEAAVIRFIAGMKQRHGERIALLCGLKIWGRWHFVHEPAVRFIAAGIARDKAEIVAAVTDLATGESADAKYAADFYSETWDAQYTSEAAVLEFIRGLQQRQGRRAGLECGLKVWARWKYLLATRPPVKVSVSRAGIDAAIQREKMAQRGTLQVAAKSNVVQNVPAARIDHSALQVVLARSAPPPPLKSADLKTRAAGDLEIQGGVSVPVVIVGLVLLAGGGYALARRQGYVR